MAATVEIDTLQGTLGDSVWFHLDLTSDVLYLRNQDMRNDSVFGEENSDGCTVLHTDSGDFAGMTIVNYWKRFGSGELDKASIKKVRDRVAVWAREHFVGQE